MRPYAITTLDLVGLTHCTDQVRLLDVAAGTGVVALEAARRGAEVLATDFAPGMVEVMRRRFAAEGLDARAEVMDGQALSLHDQSFDMGTSTFGLMFFSDPLAGLRELRRVLRTWRARRDRLLGHDAGRAAAAHRCCPCPRSS